MAKQNVFNFETMQFELVECDDLLSLIGDLNAECAAQHSAHPTCAICGDTGIAGPTWSHPEGEACECTRR